MTVVARSLAVTRPRWDPRALRFFLPLGAAAVAAGALATSKPTWAPAIVAGIVIALVVAETIRAYGGRFWPLTVSTR